MTGSCALTSSGVDVSFTWTAPQDGCYQFDTEESYTSSTSSSLTDTVLYVREGGCSGEEIGCSEDEGAGFTSIFEADVVGGTEYVVTVDGYSSFTSGDIVVDIVYLGDVCPEEICYDGLDDDGDGLSTVQIKIVQVLVLVKKPIVLTDLTTKVMDLSTVKTLIAKASVLVLKVSVTMASITKVMVLLTVMILNVKERSAVSKVIVQMV